MSSPKVYLIFGTRDSGRRAILLDLLSDLPNSENSLYFRDAETPPAKTDAELESIESLHSCQFSLNTCKIEHASISMKGSPSKIFFLPDETRDPADTVEGLQAWLKKNNCALTRVLSVVDCQRIFSQPESQSWHDACMHFSDMVLLNRRESVATQWLQDWLNAQKKIFHPTRFELVKKNKVRNPADVLDQQVFRKSLFFDSLTSIDADAFEEDTPEDLKPDLYIQRLENGKRIKPIPAL